MVHDFCVWESHRKNREPTLGFREIIIRNKDTGIDNGYYVFRATLKPPADATKRVPPSIKTGRFLFYLEGRAPSRPSFESFVSG